MMFRVPPSLGGSLLLWGSKFAAGWYVPVGKCGPLLFLSLLPAVRAGVVLGVSERRFLERSGSWTAAVFASGSVEEKGRWGGDLLTMWTVWQWLPTGFGLRSVRIVRGITDGMVPLHGILGLPGSAEAVCQFARHGGGGDNRDIQELIPHLSSPCPFLST